jgi:hypothetical protein
MKNESAHFLEVILKKQIGHPFVAMISLKWLLQHSYLALDHSAA